MNKDLIQKYNIPVPRYTSYPPANYFNEGFSEKDYIEAIEKSNYLQPQHISFYIHIPFCHNICYYCGCNSLYMPRQDYISEYIEAVKKEIKILIPFLNKDRKISQIHYGGGSPTSIPVKYIKEINELLLSNFDTIEKAEIAIEAHPGYMREKQWNDLCESGFNRISVGVQDLDLKVLATVKRKPSIMPLKDIIDILHVKDTSVNFDFIYGLPYQTTDGFRKSIKEALNAFPERIVLFSYAHVPWVNELQLKLEKHGLPIEETKDNIYQTAFKEIISSGYKSIGLDHFVKEEDDLYTALQEGNLHRNFQGYCTRKTTGQVYAFGVSGISQLNTAYSQNTKNINEYIQKINVGALPITKGYVLSKQERVVREVVNAIMCNERINWDEKTKELNLDKNIKEYTTYSKEIIDDMIMDGIIEENEQEMKVSEKGVPFIRNIVASLDPMMKNTDKKYSKPF